MAIEETAHLIFTQGEQGLQPTEHWAGILKDFRMAGEIEHAGIFLGTLVVGEQGITDVSGIPAGEVASAFSANAEPPLTEKDLERFTSGIYIAKVAWNIVNSATE